MDARKWPERASASKRCWTCLSIVPDGTASSIDLGLPFRHVSQATVSRNGVVCLSWADDYKGPTTFHLAALPVVDAPQVDFSVTVDGVFCWDLDCAGRLVVVVQGEALTSSSAGPKSKKAKRAKKKSRLLVYRHDGSVVRDVELADEPDAGYDANYVNCSVDDLGRLTLFRWGCETLSIVTLE
eukprot:TRINITY_DN11053_c0_g1_i1.p1 TRINITY_DN11053_c0_g1~~TRINITY_DN11053_c0_g1_i1.p1  ORF type:complete len:183 (+),score=40.17 TRINITY_DN11053_c0_g1_i1:602-1150(+)